MTVTTYINTVRRVSGAISGAANAAMDAISGAGADGMTVPGQRAPYGDKHLFWLAPGEEVISNRYGQADRNRDLLKAINANRAADGTPGVRGTHARTPTSGVGDAAHATADSLRDLANASRDEMRERRKEIATRVKELTKERDARKEVLDALKAERDAVRSSIADRLPRTCSRSPSRSTRSSPTGSRTGRNEAQRSWLTQQYQRHAATVQSPTDILRGDIGDAREMRRLIAQLSGRGGLTGDALSELLQEGGIEQLRAYASGPRSQLREYQALYDTRARLVSRTADAGGQAAYGRDIREQTKVTRESSQSLKKMEKRLESIEKRLEEAPKKTGAAVGDAVNGAGVGGANRRSR